MIFLYEHCLYNGLKGDHLKAFLSFFFFILFFYDIKHIYQEAYSGAKLKIHDIGFLFILMGHPHPSSCHCRSHINHISHSDPTHHQSLAVSAILNKWSPQMQFCLKLEWHGICKIKSLVTGLIVTDENNLQHVIGHI